MTGYVFPLYSSDSLSTFIILRLLLCVITEEKQSSYKTTVYEQSHPLQCSPYENTQHALKHISSSPKKRMEKKRGKLAEKIWKWKDFKALKSH